MRSIALWATDSCRPRTSPHPRPRVGDVHVRSSLLVRTADPLAQVADERLIAGAQREGPAFETWSNARPQDRSWWYSEASMALLHPERDTDHVAELTPGD